MDNLDQYMEIVGLDLAPKRLNDMLNAYRDILAEVRKLRAAHAYERSHEWKNRWPDL